MSAASGEAEDQHGEVPCPTLSSARRNWRRGSWSTGGGGLLHRGLQAQAWLLTVPEYEALADYLEPRHPLHLEGRRAWQRTARPWSAWSICPEDAS